MSKTENIQCSFCGRSRAEVKILIAGQEGHICEHCIEHAHEIVDKEFHQKKEAGKAGTLKVQKPIAIKKFMDQYIIGQDEAKKYYVLRYTITLNALTYQRLLRMMLK